MYSATRVPNDIDTSAPLELRCDISSFLSGPDGFAGRNVKASWRMMAHRVDPIAGTFESFDVASGTARTGDTGLVFIDVAVAPTVANAIFWIKR